MQRTAYSTRKGVSGLWDILALPLLFVSLNALIGTLGYWWLGRPQAATLLDAFYMTIITITTIGYGEIIHLDEVGRLFTIFVAITGIGSLFYTLTVFMDYLVMSRLVDPYGAKKMQHKIDQLKDHIIVAGLGRVGRQAALELEASGVPFVLIDPKSETQAFAHQHGFLAIEGDASDDAVLERVGVRKARGLIVTSSDDASNLYIVLSARVLNPDLFIVSRAVDEKSTPKLLRAGANRAISPYAIGGRRLAHLILSPTVVDFFDTLISKGEESLNIESVTVCEGSVFIGQSLRESAVAEMIGANILVVLRAGQVIPNPDPDYVFEQGDQLLALGKPDQLEQLEKLVSGCKKRVF